MENDDIEETQNVEPEGADAFETEVEQSADQPHLSGELGNDAGHATDEAGESLRKKARAVVKKPPSKWVLFLSEHRSECSRENPELGFADITKLLAEQYKNITEEESNRLDKLIQEHKDRWEEFQRTGGSAVRFAEEASTGSDLQFPLARIKKIAKADPDVRNISKDALVALTKASELFLAQLAVKSLAFASMRGSKSLQLDDAVQAIHTHGQFDFLVDDFPRRTKQKKAALGERSSSAPSAKATEAQADGSTAAGRRSVHSFFSAASSGPTLAAESAAPISAAIALGNETDEAVEEQEEQEEQEETGQVDE